MRHTLKTIESRDDLIGWWQDFPPRRLEFWKELLFAPGQGWLRWKTDVYLEPVAIGAFVKHEEVPVLPPVRRLLSYLREWVEAPFLMLVGAKWMSIEETEGFHEPPDNLNLFNRCRLSWEEVRPSWKNYVYLRDPDRKRHLWQT